MVISSRRLRASFDHRIRCKVRSMRDREQNPKNVSKMARNNLRTRFCINGYEIVSFAGRLMYILLMGIKLNSGSTSLFFNSSHATKGSCYLLAGTKNKATLGVREVL